jgi:hypothetical protein
MDIGSSEQSWTGHCAQDSIIIFGGCSLVNQRGWHLFPSSQVKNVTIIATRSA